MPSRPFRLLLVASTAALALALSACSPPEEAEPASSSDPNAEVVWAIEGANLSAGHMDPQTSQLDVSAMVQRGVLDSLVWQNSDGTYAPWLAKKWEISEDQTSYTFTLRDNVTFHDGEPFNAEAVKVNFDRIMDPASKSAQAASMLGGESYQSTEVVDEFTVQVNFREPYAPFLASASTPQLGFYSPAVLASSADKLAAGGPEVTVGTGPLIMTEYIPDQQIVYTRNDDYAWGPDDAGPIAFQTLRVNILPEPAVRAGVVNSGEADLASQLPPSTVSTLDDSITVDATELAGLPYSLYLNEKYGVFADQKVRQAFARAIDIDTAVEEIFFGQYQRSWSILAPTNPGYDASLEGAGTFDPELANQLLDEAGWTQRDDEGYRVKDGKRLSVRWIAWTPVPDDRAALANAIQSNLKDVGFELVRDVLEPGAYNEQYEPKSFDLTDWGFSGVDPDLLRNHLHSEGFQNASQVSDLELDTMLEDGAATTDADERAKFYGEVQQFNAEHVAIVPLYVPAAITAVGKRIEGVEYDLSGRPLFYGVSVSG